MRDNSTDDAWQNDRNENNIVSSSHTYNDTPEFKCAFPQKAINRRSSTGEIRLNERHSAMALNLLLVSNLTLIFAVMPPCLPALRNTSGVEEQNAVGGTPIILNTTSIVCEYWIVRDL